MDTGLVSRSLRADTAKTNVACARRLRLMLITSASLAASVARTLCCRDCETAELEKNDWQRCTHRLDSTLAPLHPRKWRSRSWPRLLPCVAAGRVVRCRSGDEKIGELGNREKGERESVIAFGPFPFPPFPL